MTRLQNVKLDDRVVGRKLADRSERRRHCHCRPRRSYGGPRRVACGSSHRSRCRSSGFNSVPNVYFGTKNPGAALLDALSVLGLAQQTTLVNSR